jgi:hypothetical protein
VVPASSPIQVGWPTWWRPRRAQSGKLNWATNHRSSFDFIVRKRAPEKGLPGDRGAVPYRKQLVQAANDLAEGRIQLMMSVLRHTSGRWSEGRKAQGCWRSTAREQRAADRARCSDRGG